MPITKKKTKRKEFPSQKTYRENNPSITFRLKKIDKEKLNEIIEESGKPLSRWMTDFIHDRIVPYEETSKFIKRINALEDRIEEIQDVEKFIVPCSICGKPIFLSSTQGNWDEEIYPKLKEAFAKQYHLDCDPNFHK